MSICFDLTKLRGKKGNPTIDPFFMGFNSRLARSINMPANLRTNRNITPEEDITFLSDQNSSMAERCLKYSEITSLLSSSVDFHVSSLFDCQFAKFVDRDSADFIVRIGPHGLVSIGL